LVDNENFIVNENYKSFVRLEKFNDSSIDILVLCFTSTKDWDKYLEIKEGLGMFIKEKIESLGLSFAYPTRSIFIEKE
jgi:MscS family membrane protein